MTRLVRAALSPVLGQEPRPEVVNDALDERGLDVPRVGDGSLLDSSGSPDAKGIIAEHGQADPPFGAADFEEVGTLRGGEIPEARARHPARGVAHCDGVLDR